MFAVAWLAEAWESVWPRLVPLFLLACVFATLSWLGVWHLVPEWARWISLVLFAGAALTACLPLREISKPRRQQVYRRIERASGFENRPVTTQIDAPANADDPYSVALWAEHQRRMAQQLDNLAAGTARPDANRYDRFALRAILPLFAFIALFYSYGVNGGRLGDILEPQIDKRAVLARLDMWVSPPAYAAKPPLYFAASLVDEQKEEEIAKASTLEGSELTVNYVGEENVTALYRSVDGTKPLDGGEGEETGASATAKAFTHILDQSGEVEILLRDTVIARWQIAIEQDRVPEIMLDKVPNAALSGALELNYSVKDDYGVVSARGIISAIENGDPDARPLVEAPEFDLPLPRARARSGSSKVNRDLTSHPFAGSEVVLTLEARDDPGQIGRSKPMTITLPGRNFVDPMAMALVEQRRLLALDARNASHVADLLDAVTSHTDVFELDFGAFVSLKTAYRMMVPGRGMVASDDRLREAMDVLWETALAIELGDLSEVERKLREAQENLSEALEEGASEEEIDKLMEELRQAMNDFLEQMAREMARNPIENSPLNNLDNMRTLSQRDLEKMMQRIEDLAKSGSKDAARELLAEMQRMLDNLSAGRHQQQRQAEGNELNQALDKLSELMQRQQQLMDETFSMQRRQPSPDGQQQQNNQGQQGEQQQGQHQDGNQRGPMTPEEFAEAMRQLQEQQEALEQELGELGQQLEDLGLDPSEGFGEAGEEMAEAGRNLGKGQTGDAASNQGQALEALRRGAQSMMQQMAGDRNQGGQQPGQAGRNSRQRQGNDPLGRESGSQARTDNNDTRIPGEIDAQRAREIMEAIRKRLSDPLRPLLERNYLERLLQSR